MRFAGAILTLFVFASAGVAQPAAPPPQDGVRIRGLSLVSDSLPHADRERVIRSLEGHAYLPSEFEERTRIGLRNLGYYYAQVEDAELTQVRDDKAGKSADVAIKVVPGAQYRLRFIEFKNETLFPPERLRSQFPIQQGDLFCASSMMYGLEKLKSLYHDRGYINFGAIPIPAIDESHRTVDLTIDIDEGKPYVFGHLTFDGVEPRAGAAKALIESWKSLQGKTYNPELPKSWLASNWPAAKQNVYSVQAVENDPREVNLSLQFP